jgi:hypothetical protein
MFAARNLTRLARPSALAVPHRPFHATAARLGLLKGMDPMLTADLLHVLRSAGHGDEITLVDCNFPAASTATKTVTGVPIVLAGCDLPTAVDAICSIMPLDFFVECPALCAARRAASPEGSLCHLFLVPSHCKPPWSLGSDRVCGTICVHSYMAPEPGNELPPGTVPSRRPFLLSWPEGSLTRLLAFFLLAPHSRRRGPRRNQNGAREACPWCQRSAA